MNTGCNYLDYVKIVNNGIYIKEINMCMFCAAIPATAAVAAKLNADQQAEIHEAEESGAEIHKKPIKAVSLGVILLLAVGSVFYHVYFRSFI